MKHSFIIILFLGFLNGNLFSNSSFTNEYIVDNEEVSISIDNKELDGNFFVEINYDKVVKNINYKTNVKVELIKVVDEKGDTIFHLSLGSKDITIGKSLLESGHYTFLFMKDGNVEQTNKVMIK